MRGKVPGRHRLRIAATILALIALLGCYSRDAGWTLAAPTTHAAKLLPGWPGGITSYQGRYKLTKSSDAGFAKSGELTLFGRVVPRVKGLQLSGILALYTADGTSVLYLTNFGHAGTKQSAVVHEGIYTGPIIGHFALVTRKGAAMTAAFVPDHGTDVHLWFSQISTSPHP